MAGDLELLKVAPRLEAAASGIPCKTLRSCFSLTGRIMHSPVGKFKSIWRLKCPIHLESQRSDNFDVIVDKLLLDIKAMVLLSSTVQNSREIIRQRFRESPDDEVKTFVEIVASETKTRFMENFLIAAGEFVLSAFLLYFGLILSVPVFLYKGKSTLVLSYFQSLESSVFSSYGTYTAVIVVDLLLSALLLVSSFYALRMASREISRLGLHISKK